MTEEHSGLSVERATSTTASEPLFPLLDADRLRWIKTWAKGWRSALTARYGDENYYAELPLDVAVSMVEELVAYIEDRLSPDPHPGTMPPQKDRRSR